jgi:hypothetical protein
MFVALPASAEPQAGGASTQTPETASTPAAPASTPVITGPKVELTGTLGLATSGTVHALTFGGPRLSLGVGDFRFALSFYPSLVYNSGWTSAPVRPVLGAGPEISWQRIAVFAPVYFLGTDYAFLVGLGYRF